MMTAWWWLCVVSLLVSQAVVARAGRVVMLPVPFTSHIRYHSNVARALVARGQEVWFFMPDYLMDKGESVINITGCHVIQFTTVPNLEDDFMENLRDAYFEQRPQSLDRVFAIYKELCDSFLTDQSLLKTLHDLNLDLFVIDSVLIAKMLTILPYRLGVPFAFLGTFYDPVMQKIPFSPSVTPCQLFPFTDHMTLSQRLQTAFYYVMSYFNDPSTVSDPVSRYAPEMPSISMEMLMAKAEIWLVETDHILDYPRPSIPNVKLIGGTATGPSKPLPAKYKMFMDNAPEGVVVICFGSYILNLPEHISTKIFNALRKLPFRAVFRSNLTSPDPEKIMTSAWIPQNDLLGHEKVRVFFSHCGKNGQYEALYHAIPMVCAPVYTDQPYNAERMRVKGMAETIDLNTVTEEELRATILKVGTDKRYKKAISVASRLFQIEFGVPMETAAFWLDHIVKHGASHMRSAGQDYPYYVFVGLDVLAVFVAAASVMVSVMVLCGCLVCRCVCWRYRKRKTD